MAKQGRQLELEVLAQPDDITCGPTCLHAVYRYWGDDVSLSQVIREVVPLPDGGTLAVVLGCHALARGYRAVLHTCNLHMFDPTWFEPGVDLAERLSAQREAKDDPKLRLASDKYLEFLELGGLIRYGDLSSALLQGFLNQEVPVLTGLSATYLYGCAREVNEAYDDVGGDPQGHFVVLSGYDPTGGGGGETMVADPLRDNPGFGSHYYRVSTDKLLAAILLGILTYDANMLMITPSGHRASQAP